MLEVGKIYRFSHQENLVQDVRGLQFVVVNMTDSNTYVTIYKEDGSILPFPPDNGTVWPGDSPNSEMWSVWIDRTSLPHYKWADSKLIFKFI
jgi:hypothetical protein